MLSGKRLLAVVPARGGSKGLKLKNIQPVLGVPIVARVGKVVKELGYFDRAICSTDHPEIAKVAEGAGLAVPFFRPPEISGDLISDLQVLTHALTEIEKLDGKKYDLVVMLQPTSPMRTAAHVDATIRKCLDGGYDAVWTLSAVDLKFHPLKLMSVAADGAMDYWDPRGVKIIARQMLTPAYYRNGAAYAITRDCLLVQKSIMGTKAAAHVIEEPLVDIDGKADLEAAELALKAQGRT